MNEALNVLNNVPYFYKQIDGDFDEIKVYVFGDWHVEENTVSWHLLEYIVEKLKEPNVFLINPGDTFEIPLGDDIGTLQEQEITTSEAFIKIYKLLLPVAHKIWLFTEGNHPKRARKRATIDITGILCTLLGIPYARGQAALTVRFGKNKMNGKPIAYTFGVTYGWSGGRTMGSKAQARFWEGVIWENVDAAMIGHIHTPGWDPMTRLRPDPQNKKIHTKEVPIVSAPSAMQYAEYAQKKGYPPPSFRIPIFTLKGDRKSLDLAFPDIVDEVNQFIKQRRKGNRKSKKKRG